MKDVFFTFWIWVFWILALTAVVLGGCTLIGLYAGLFCRCVAAGWRIAWSIF